VTDPIQSDNTKREQGLNLLNVQMHKCLLAFPAPSRMMRMAADPRRSLNRMPLDE
jgi:hypothetical protein